jgi:hypothetical protein
MRRPWGLGSPRGRKSGQVGPDLLPSRRQARTLVVSLSCFWLAAAGLNLDDGSGASDSGLGSSLATVLFVFLAAAIGLFNYTLFRVWEPETNESPWTMMFSPSLEIAREARRVTLALFRPSWFRSALGATEWGLRVCLMALMGSLAVTIGSGVWLWRY